MTEILTESFCERCGTRYTFESARPRTRLKGVKVLSRGLKNFVLSDDTSMDEAMAAARSETDREASAHQLDAFHKTFNFCMSCRQYTCPNCWNEIEARCLTCAPLALAESPAVVDDLPSFRDALLAGQPVPGNGTLDQDPAHLAWSPITDVAPQEDLDVPAAEAAEADDAAPAGDAAAAVTAASDDEGVGASDAPAAPTDPLGKAAAQTAGLLRRFRPGQSLYSELDSFESERDDTPAKTEHLAGEPAAPVEPEPLQLEEPEAPAESWAAPEPEPEPLAAAMATDVVEQPTWRITAPDAAPTVLPAPGEGADDGVPLQASGVPATPVQPEPQWPASPQWPSATPSAGLPFLGRPATPQGGIDALWAASNQELVTAAPAPKDRLASGIQPCISCGLSLSATARFCRRCGTLQGR
jgi:ribosomal protein L40E